MFRFGILGCGMIANIHARAIQALPEAELLGVADHKPEMAKSFAEKFGGKSYESYAQMLSDDLLDVVCICTPSCFHVQNAIEALEMGKHVVLEKPMALTVEDSDRLIETCQRTGKLLTVISQLRFSEDVRRVKKLLEENSFGRLSLCNLKMNYYRDEAYYASSPWKGKKAFDGGGALMNQGIHGVDLLQYLVGPVKEVRGRIKTVSHRIEVEDTAVAMLTFDNGALGVIEASTCAYPGFARKIEIYGDEGFVVLKEDQIEQLTVKKQSIPIEHSSAMDTAKDPSLLNFDLHRCQMQNLLNAIRGKDTLLVDACEGKKAVQIIEEIYNSP